MLKRRDPLKFPRVLLAALRFALPAAVFALWARSYFVCDQYLDVRERLLRSSDRTALPLRSGITQPLDWQSVGSNPVVSSRSTSLISGQGLVSVSFSTFEWQLTTRVSYEGYLRVARLGNVAREPGYSSIPSPDYESPAPPRYGIPLLTDIHFARFGIYHARGTRSGMFMDTYVVHVPYWLLTVVLSIPLVARYAFVKYDRPGRCSNCNYDLRASQDRCPECGYPIPNPNRGAAVPPAP
jgi:hypothetical protein